jgi:hypothetical protein
MLRQAQSQQEQEGVQWPLLLRLGMAAAVAVVHGQMGQQALLMFSSACLARKLCHVPCTLLLPAAVLTHMVVQHVQGQHRQQQQQGGRQVLTRCATGSCRPHARPRVQLLRALPLLLRQRLHLRHQES